MVKAANGTLDKTSPDGYLIGGMKPVIPHRPDPHTTRTDKEIAMKVAGFSVIAGALVAVICGATLDAAAQQEPILGCVKPGTGLLRIPRGNEGCKAEETPLGFNDLPLLVALRNQVQQLQKDVKTLQDEVKILQDKLVIVEACTDSICSPE